eukprot:GSChrysophyteH1.ASY1.ANO1.881.1 assembled CDS
MAVPTILSALKETLKSRGYGLLHLTSEFREADKDGSGSLDWEEFAGTMQRSHLSPSRGDMRALFKYLDVNNDERISISEFLDIMTEELSPLRKQLIDDAYMKLDPNGYGSITMVDIGRVAKFEKHPLVLSGKMSCYNLMLDFFETLNSISTTGKISCDEFEHYYSQIAAYDTDASFQDMMSAVWGVSPVQLTSSDDRVRMAAANAFREKKEQNAADASLARIVSKLPGRKAISPPRSPSNPRTADLRQQLKARGAHGMIGLQRKFKIIDDDGNGLINSVEFKKVLREMALVLEEAEISELFSFFDNDRNGVIDFDEFLNGVRGPMSSKRMRLPSDIVGVYDASKHPDVVAGRRGVVDGKVTLEEFCNYYNNISASIDNDDYFELMIRNAWHISGGEGQAANSANRRVLVTHADGSQTVEEIEHDLGLKADDKQDMMKRLRQQGIRDVTGVDTRGSVDDSGRKIAKTGSRSNGYDQKDEVASPRSQMAIAQEKGSVTEISLSQKAPDSGVAHILDKLKKELRSRSVSSGFIGMQRKFRIMDDDGSKSISLAEFKKAMNEMNMDLSGNDLKSLFRYLDTDGSGSLDFEEFIQGIRDPLNPRRLALVEMAFDRLDVDGNGIVDGEEIARIYDASKHPDVIAGRQTPSQVLNTFLSTFDVGGVVDGKVTRQEFCNYYNNISASIDNDDYFELMIRNAWHISGGEGQAANSANRRVLVTHADGSQSVQEIKNDLGLASNDKEGLLKRLHKQGLKNLQGISTETLIEGGKKSNTKGRGKTAPIGDQQLSIARRGASSQARPSTAPTRHKAESNPGIALIISKLKKAVKSRGAHGFIGLQRKFRIMDDDGSGALNLGEFKKGLNEMQLGLHDSEMRLLFTHFDTDHSGSIEFEEFVQGMREPLSNRRRELVQRAFSKIDIDGSGTVDDIEIAKIYDASKHPDVIAGKRSPTEILQEFLATFDVGGVVDGKVTRQEFFVNYYTNIGASIDNDDYFELMIRNAWHISGGEGQAANSANRRVLVTHADGSQTVEEIENDLNINKNEKKIISELEKQGLQVQGVSFYDGKDLAAGGGKRTDSLVRRKASVKTIIRHLKHELATRGARGFIGLQRKFQIMDDDGNRSLNLTEFKKAINEMNLGLEAGEVQRLFKYFDTDDSGDISFDEFIYGVRDPLSERRLALVYLAFSVLDKDGNGVVDGEDLADVIDTTKHPEVIAGRLSQAEVLREFLDTFDVGGVVDGKVTRQEFVNYYTNIGASIDNDDYFELMIRNAWHISGGEGQAANSANRRVLVTHADGSQTVEEIENDLNINKNEKKIISELEKQGLQVQGVSFYDGKDLAAGGVKTIIRHLKHELATRGARGFIGLQRKFQIMDDDGNRSLNLTEFKKAINEMNLGLEAGEVQRLFKYFDTDDSGDISFDEFIYGVRDPLSERRLALVYLAFSVLDKDGNGVVDGEDLADVIDTTKHPEVIAGRLSQAEVLREFLDTFDVGGVVDGKVTRQEFVNYYTNIGASIDNDDYFELMIRNAWHISGGEGQAANSANRRVLVTHADGSQTVEEIKNDLGLKADDKASTMAYFKSQGIDVQQISNYGLVDDEHQVKASKKIISHRKVKDEVANIFDMRGNKRGAAGIKLLLEKLRKQLKELGAHGYLGIVRKFKIMDDDGNKGLSLGEFKKGMAEMNMKLSEQEFRALFNYFDTDKNGTIECEEFVQGLRTPLSKKRRDLIVAAYSILDLDGNGFVDRDEICKMYDASKHPDVISGKKSEDQILDDFLRTFDVGGVVDGKVTLEEFCNYYNNISASIDNDDYFELMIRNAWHISGGEGQAANSANRRVLVTHADGSQTVEEIKNDLGLASNDKEGLLERLHKQGVDASQVEIFGMTEDAGAEGQARNTRYNSDVAAIVKTLKKNLAKHGAHGFVGLQRKFRIADDNGDRKLEHGEFRKVLLETEMHLSEEEIIALFNFFDKTGDGKIDFEEFIRGLRGPLSDRRIHLIDLAYQALDTNGDGIVTAEEVAKLYDASKHPDVITGKRTVDEILTEFLSTFDVGGVVDGKVTRQEFVNYYNNISASIDNDDYFELMIRNAWHISGGEGQAANSANRRVLVTRADGSQSVQEIKNDLGLKADKEEVEKSKLRFESDQLHFIFWERRREGGPYQALSSD